jgi:hypothetical protein
LEKQYEPFGADQFTGDERGAGVSKPAATFKREFIEPVVSFPVDVLESTTFFQVIDSGVTGRDKKE